MASCWFISAPLYSHTDWGGFLPTALAMRARGHDILWISEPPLKPAIKAAGLGFRHISQTGWLWPPPPPPDLSALPPIDAVNLRYKRALDTWLSEDLVAAAVKALTRLAAEHGVPDAIVSEPFLSAAAIAAEILDVPLIICGWPAQATLDENALFPVQRDLSSDSQQRIQGLMRPVWGRRTQLLQRDRALHPQPNPAHQLLHPRLVSVRSGNDFAPDSICRWHRASTDGRPASLAA